MRIFFGLCALFLGTALIATVTGFPVLPVAATVLLLSAIPKPTGVLRTDINVTDLITEFGNYYIQGNGDNMKRLRTLVRQDTVTPSFATPLITTDTRERGSTAVIDEIIQAFQKKFTAKGNPKFLPEEYDLFNIKIDTEYYPDDITKTWLGFLGSLKEPDRKNWPIVRYIWEQLIVPRMKADLELKAYYKGVYEAPVDNVAGASAKSMDGIRKLLTSARVNDLALGAVNSNNILDKIEKAVDDVPSEFDSVPMGIFMSKKLQRAYARDYRNTFGGNANYNERMAIEVDFATNYEIVGLPSMNGTDDIWITPLLNFQHLKRSGKPATPHMESAKRQVSVMMDWWEGFSFGILEMVWFHKEDGSGSGS